jgi:protein involved in polysaccharide export with SLBB domain
MTLINVYEKTSVGGFNKSQKAMIDDALKTAYDGSATARAMLDNWVQQGGVINISYVPNVSIAILFEKLIL